MVLQELLSPKPLQSCRNTASGTESVCMRDRSIRLVYTSQQRNHVYVYVSQQCNVCNVCNLYDMSASTEQEGKLEQKTPIKDALFDKGTTCVCTRVTGA